MYFLKVEGRGLCRILWGTQNREDVLIGFLCKTAGITFDTIQYFNKRNPNPSVTPKWSDKPLLKSWEKTKPTLGFPRPDRFSFAPLA